MIFANIMEDKKRGGRYWSKLLQKYRFVIMTDSSFEKKLLFKLSRLNVFVFAGIFVFVCFFSTVLLITYTPLGKYFAEEEKLDDRKNLIALQLRVDSLERPLLNNAVYLENLKNRLSDGDSLFQLSAAGNNYLMFFTPISGLITDVHNSKIKHFGVDLVGKEKSRISSVLDGTVIISHWTSETGYVIAIQHENDYISLYKHNSLLLKEVGEIVTAGEHVAVIGSSGELSSGPHLHFELWHKGASVNPEDYISF
jgi:murein DD-endopeptidase MepM/ murein hydrolase activator NlpD